MSRRKNCEVLKIGTVFHYIKNDELTWKKYIPSLIHRNGACAVKTLKVPTKMKTHSKYCTLLLLYPNWYASYTSW